MKVPGGHRVGRDAGHWGIYGLNIGSPENCPYLMLSIIRKGIMGTVVFLSPLIFR